MEKAETRFILSKQIRNDNLKKSYYAIWYEVANVYLTYFDGTILFDNLLSCSLFYLYEDALECLISLSIKEKIKIKRIYILTNNQVN